MFCLAPCDPTSSISMGNQTNGGLETQLGQIRVDPKHVVRMVDTISS